uniref:Transcriptional adapter 1 n=1 Tax=Lygus hesperus TaxID=30085 RepID=A0A0A9XS49_LYGHE
MELQGKMELHVRKCLKLRAALKKRLKDDFPEYIAAVVQWIRERTSRAQLDMQVFKILDDSVRKTHFDFLVNLSKLCWGVSSLRIETSIPFVPSSVTASLEDLQTRDPQDVEDEGVLFKKTYADLSLPGVELIRARLYLMAWDSGLTHVDSKVSRLLHIAMKHYVKNIIHVSCSETSTSINRRTKSRQALSFWWALMHTNCDRPGLQYVIDRRDPLKT